MTLADFRGVIRGRTCNMQNIACLIRLLACCLYRSSESGDKQFWGLITHLSGKHFPGAAYRVFRRAEDIWTANLPLNQPIGGLNAHRSPVSLRSVVFCCLPADFKSGTKPQPCAPPRKARTHHATDRRREALPYSVRGADQQRSYRS